MVESARKRLGLPDDASPHDVAVAHLRRLAEVLAARDNDDAPPDGPERTE